MCDLNKITEKTKDLFNQMKRLQKGTKDESRYLLGVNGKDQVVLDDLRKDVTILTSAVEKCKNRCKCLC